MKPSVCEIVLLLLITAFSAAAVREVQMLKLNGEYPVSFLPKLR